MDLQGKKVCVFGSGKSGTGAAGLLVQKGACPIIYDGNDKLDPEDILAKIKDAGETRVILGELPEAVLNTLDLVVMSPGVPLDLPIVKKMREKNIPIWGEIELAFQSGKGTLLAITGTNGKTTTTALLGEIIKAYYPETYVVGNIGIPYTDIVSDQTEKSVTAAEISSFQLETIDTFHPKVSAITNITEDHLNRHHTMEEYIRVKEQIASNQTSDDFCILNYEDEVLRAFGEKVKPQVIYFSSLRTLNSGIYLDGDKIIYDDGQARTEVTKIHDLKLLGLHNYENVMVATGMALCAGVPMDCIRKVIQSFPGVEHRIEYVTEKNGVAYYNDSKGTNPDAAIKGIQAMNRPTMLIGGGFDKNSSYEEWIQAFDGKVRYLVLLGQTREKIAETAMSLGFPAERILLVNDLKEAVEICVSKAEPGQAVLLSPACASWGQFDNYEQRGDLFKEYVYNLTTL